MNPPAPRLSVLDALRGLAALSVCWCHFTVLNKTFLPDGFLKYSGAFGWLGVEIFFVISGFIIPYALHRSNYSISDYGTFVLKRIIRLDPPYLVSLLVVLVIGYASAAVPGFRGPPFAPTITQIASHLGYANAFFGYPWLNAVYWTLAIELQYYVLVGLLFPVIASCSAISRTALFGGLAALAIFFPAEQHIFHWLFLFMLGMAAFQLRVGIIRRGQFFMWVLVLGLGAWYNGGLADSGIDFINSLPVEYVKMLVAIAGVGTSLLIGLVDIDIKPKWLFFGQISYSLYLVHVPIGNRLINLSQRFVHGMPGSLAVLALAMAVSVAAAWLLYRYVERPAQQWSSRIRYEKTRIARSV